MAIFGTNSIGGTTGTSTISGGQIFPVFCKFVAPEYGTVTSMSFRTNAVLGTISVGGAIWNGGGTSGTPFLVSVSQETTPATLITSVPQWVTINFNNIPVSAGTTYWLMGWADNSFNYYYTAGSTNQAYYGALYTWETISSPESGSTTGNDNISIYVTYTPRAADASVYGSIDRISSIDRLTSIDRI